MRHCGNKQGFGVVEYLLVSAAVLVVVIAFTARSGPFAQQVNRILNSPANMLHTSAQAVQFNQLNNM